MQNIPNIVPGGDTSRYQILARQKAIGIGNCDVIEVMRQRKFICTPSQYSLAVKGRTHDEKAEKIVARADEIITEMEKQISKRFKKEAKTSEC